MSIVLLSRDLMLSSRVEGAAQRAGMGCVVAADQKAALSAVGQAECRCLLIDLQLPQLELDSLVAAIRAAASSEVSIVACGPHVHQRLLQKASDAGCDRVLSRGQLDRELTEGEGWFAREER